MIFGCSLCPRDSEVHLTGLSMFVCHILQPEKQAAPRAYPWHEVDTGGCTPVALTLPAWDFHPRFWPNSTPPNLRVRQGEGLGGMGGG
jgi:hypothetical protein